MRISDWSSDVFSPDLRQVQRLVSQRRPRHSAGFRLAEQQAFHPGRIVLDLWADRQHVRWAAPCAAVGEGVEAGLRREARLDQHPEGGAGAGQSLYAAQIVELRRGATDEAAALAPGAEARALAVQRRPEHDGL